MNHEHTHHKVVFGFWVYLMSDCVLFASLFATFAVLSDATAGGPALADFFSLPFVFVETIILLVSSFTAGLALAWARHGAARSAITALAVTGLLGIAFLGMEVREFGHLIAEGAGPDTSASLSAFFTLVGTHGAHVFVGVLWLVVLMYHLLARGPQSGVVRKLTCFSLFWHFLDIVWVCIFTFVYLWSML